MQGFTVLPRLALSSFDRPGWSWTPAFCLSFLSCCNDQPMPAVSFPKREGWACSSVVAFLSCGRLWVLAFHPKGLRLEKGKHHICYERKWRRANLKTFQGMEVGGSLSLSLAVTLSHFSKWLWERNPQFKSTGLFIIYSNKLIIYSRLGSFIFLSLLKLGGG